MDNLKPTKKNDRDYYLFALKIVGDFGVSLAAPVVVFALIGQSLDEKYQTRPWFLILGFVVAAVSSGAIIYRKAKKYGEIYKKM